MTVSLKVLAPALVGIVTGLALVIVGKITGDGTLSTVGLSVITAALVQAGVGYQVPHATRAVRRRSADRPS